MNLRIEVEREDDGRWIAEVPDLPGVLAYGADQASAVARAQALAARVMAERLEQAGDEYLQARARRGSRMQYEAALAQAPDVEPDVYDRLGEAAALLDPEEERAMAEEGLAADFSAWPEYATAAAEEQGHHVEDRESSVIEVPEARSDLLRDVPKVMEDVALVRAIQEGEASEPVSRDEVFRELESIRQRSELTEADAALLADEIDRAVWARARAHTGM